uniref:Uncharacterized protein n=1 Tax=Podoviridae sp. ctoyw14 TaxID=2826578 RepID=A0A8S5LVK7_9CAUD|nr:MAG TPA: hypothetical protein [Podoviridae sp. ctoyw14]
MFTEKWPYTNFHELNLDWILDTLKKQDAAIADFISLNSITYANPLQWDITRQYPKNQVVLDTNGDGYLSVQPVPVGVEIDNTDYWTKIGNFSELWSTVKLAITAADEGLKTTASADRASGDLVWLNNTLYVCTTAITRGTEYGTNNTTKTTIDARLANLAQAVKTLQDNITDINTTLPNKIDKDTSGDLAQTVSGAMTVNVTGDLSFNTDSNINLQQNGVTLLGVQHREISLSSIGRVAPISFFGVPQFKRLEPVNIDDNYAYVTMRTGDDNKDTNFLVSRTGKIPGGIKPSPRSIEEFQDLKKDGTDDITDTLNTYTKQFPLFIPVGIYQISAPVQLKHSLYGASASRDPARGSSDTILQYTGNPTAFGSLGVLTVSGNDVDGNVVIGNLDIICNGMIGGIVYTTDVYTDNYIYNVSIGGVKSYGVYLQPSTSQLSRYCYMDNVTVWGFSDVHPAERVAGNVAFYWGDKSPDCDCNNLLAMVCQTGFDCRTNVFGCNWISYNGIPSGGTGGADANTWWESTCGLKITNNDVHINNLYLDTCRRGIIFDGPGKAAAYITNLIYTVNDDTATTGEGNAALALIGTSPSPQLTVDGGVINRSAKVSTTAQTIGQYPVTAMVCKINNAYIYTKREYIFSGNSQYICKAGEHRCIDLAITDQTQYTVDGQSETGDPEQYKAFAYIPLPSGSNTSQGCIRICDRNNIDYTVFISNNPESGSLFAISAFDNRKLNQAIYGATAGAGRTVTWDVVTNLDKLYYVNDGAAIILYFKRPASYGVTVQVSGFTPGNSPVILDRIRNMDGTPMDFPRWSNHDGMTAIKVLRPNIS